MDTQKVNGVSPKENGSHRRPHCYSVETPYGFHLDLDFLKYVDDIEKGNTIRRVPIQRRQRGRSSGALSRNLSLPGYGCRPPQWNSTGILFPKPRLADSHQSYEYQSTDSGSAGFARQVEPSYSSLTAAEMDATIQAFDEQPLGLHVRPNLLRASSLPLTVLLRKHSESTEDPVSPNGSRDYLAQENGSSEDVFHSPERKNGTLQRLTVALQRVGELEEEIRVIPELRAQICILQEERELLLHRFQSLNDTKEPLDFCSDILQTRPTSTTQVSKTVENQRQARDDWMNREYDQLEENLKASSEQVDAIVIPLSSEREVSGTEGSLPGTKTVRDNKDPLDHADRATSLTETLQRKVVMLEQKLHDLESDLDKSRDQLKEQVQEGHMKDERIKELSKSAETLWERAERMGHLDNARNAQDLQFPIESRSEKVEASVQTQFQESRQCGQVCSEEQPLSKQTARSHTEIEHHVRRVKELLNEQWECLCGTGRVLSSEHLPPRVGSIQKQLDTLVSLLSLYVSPDGELSAPGQESKMEDPISVNKSREESQTGVDTEESLFSLGRSAEGKDEAESSFMPKELEEHSDHKIFLREAIQPEQENITLSTNEQKEEDLTETIPHEGGDSGEVLKQEINEVKCPDDKPETNEDNQTIARSETDSKELSQDEGGRETAMDEDFMAACCFLNKHMKEVSDPDEEMRQALTVVFQQWFHVSAEEDSSPDTVSLYLHEVSTKTPSVLQFLVNMVDDNGNTALHYSVSHPNFHIVKLLLDTGVCEVDLRNKMGYTSIMLASLVSVDSPQDLKVMEQLMKLGDVNARAGQVGQTALHLAVRHGRASTVKLLLSQGANINAQDRAGTTALISACDRGHTDIVRILLQNPECDIGLTDQGGRRALSLATQASHTEIADLLKARANTRGPDRCKVA
ncbi:KN motif and ankyrin repeat domain-containing protein 4-like isoform X1 [Hoplias malabaricus]|uniref:KN motif and ankyrin repeat domain-containing protein 4-like isoform X1 n=1 Tax=Hoplias malabaricus TaxID=27720 RepID=UPI003461D2FC